MNLLFLLWACAPDVRDADGDGDPDVAAEADADADADTDADADADADADTDTDPADAAVADLDATDAESWVYFDLASGEADGSGWWSLAFQRYTVQVNGGVSGDGGVEAAILEGQDFAALAEAPADGYAADTAEALVFDTWYDYDQSTHVLTAADKVYVVREPDGDHFKLQFIDYYDDAGNSGHPSFRWAPLAGPGGAP